jgi:hypothetical protein
VTIQPPNAKDAETVNANSGGVDTENKVTSLRPRIRSRVLALYRRSPGIIAAGAIAVAFAAAYLLAPPMGRDFSAQLAHAQLAESHWPELLDLRWYSGFNPLGYSVLSPPVMAVLGVRLTTALAYVASVVLFAALLKRTAVSGRHRKRGLAATAGVHHRGAGTGRSRAQQRVLCPPAEPADGSWGCRAY